MQIRSDFRHRVSLRTVRGINRVSPTDESMDFSLNVLRELKLV